MKLSIYFIKFLFYLLRTIFKYHNIINTIKLKAYEPLKSRRHFLMIKIIYTYGKIAIHVKIIDCLCQSISILYNWRSNYKMKSILGLLPKYIIEHFYTPPKKDLGGYIGVTVSVGPSVCRKPYFVRSISHKPLGGIRGR